MLSNEPLQIFCYVYVYKNDTFLYVKCVLFLSTYKYITYLDFMIENSLFSEFRCWYTWFESIFEFKIKFISIYMMFLYASIIPLFLKLLMFLPMFNQSFINIKHKSVDICLLCWFILISNYFFSNCVTLLRINCVFKTSKFFVCWSNANVN